MKARNTVRTTVTTDMRREISYDELRALLGVPEGASILVEVPGGGDWSNTDLEIDNRNQPLVVKFRTVSETEKTEET